MLLASAPFPFFARNFCQACIAGGGWPSLLRNVVTCQTCSSHAFKHLNLAWIGYLNERAVSQLDPAADEDAPAL